jgi:hypothetical protein
MPVTNRISREAEKPSVPASSGVNGKSTSRLTATASQNRLRTKICTQVNRTPAIRASRSVRAIERWAR